MNRWPMRRLPNCPALRQNCGCSRMIMCWILAAAGAGWPSPLPRLNPRPKSPASPCRKTSLRLPAMLSAQHRKPTGSALRCATIGNKPAALTRLYQLACSNMSGRNIMTAILPALPDYSQPTGWRWFIRLRSANDPAGAIGGSTNIFSPAAICRRLNRCPPPPFGTA